ncbi:MAG: hypothetical protein IKK75_09800 [Clostridia bacterium]|nr:hypothetical protein [Clostridia bacterium]
MKKKMGGIGFAAIMLIAIMALVRIISMVNSQKEMAGVQQYMAQRYPGETFTYSGVQKGGRGAYVIARPAKYPGTTFRVFSVDGGSTYHDAYYTVTLKDEAGAKAQQLVRQTFPSAKVVAKVYQLIEGETILPYPTLQNYCSKNGANIDLFVVVDASDSAVFTQANVEKALQALSPDYISETITFVLAQQGKSVDVTGMDYASVKSKAKDWTEQQINARINADGSWQFR